jgi:hypothetical protein
MNVTMTNLGAVAVPFSSSQDRGWAALLEPSEPYQLDSAAVTVASVGDNPTASEEFTEGLQNFFQKLGEMLTFWRDHSQQLFDGPEQVNVEIVNHGPNGLRVLLGANTNEVEVGSGMTFVAQAAEWVELRELGV